MHSVVLTLTKKQEIHIVDRYYFLSQCSVQTSNTGFTALLHTVVIHIRWSPSILRSTEIGCR